MLEDPRLVSFEKRVELTHDASEKLSLFEEHFGMSLLSACYPLDSRLVYEDKEEKYMGLAENARPVLESAIPEPLRDLCLVDDVMKDCSDVASFLCEGGALVRQDGERVGVAMDTFRGKYVLVCCFNVPVLWGAKDFQALLDICHELISSLDNFEMVMVARMNALADTETVFDNFFKAFPSSCLAVPYEESERRDNICKLLGLSTTLRFHIYDTDGTIVPFLGACPTWLGAEAFPFTRESILQTHGQHQQLWKSRLDQLLRLNSPPVVYKFNPAGGPREEAFVSDVISNNHVGLYMCITGNLVPLLHKLYEQCRSNQQEFEIVVLYCPFLKMLDSEIFKANIDWLLEEENVRGWWCCPFNNSVSQRFMGLTCDYIHPSINPSHSDSYDKLVIVGPDGKVLDIYGAEVIKHHGIDAYPFTRRACVEEEMKRAREITLESILVADVFRGSDTIPAAELVSSKKKVVVLMDGLRGRWHYDPFLLRKLVPEYQELKQNGGTEFEMVFINNAYEFEMVFINDAYEEEEEEDGHMEVVEAQHVKEMPWFVYPHNGIRTSSLKYLRKLVGDSALVGFGEDGRLCSFTHPRSPDAIPYCWTDHLYENMYAQFGFNARIYS